MGEGQPIHREEPRVVGEWDPVALKAPLGVRPHETQDLFFGKGAGYRIGETQLSIYPEHQAVEVATPEVVVTMRRPTEMTIVDDGVVFEAHTPHTLVTLGVYCDGTTILSSAPIPAEPEPEKEDPAKVRLIGSVIHDPHVSETDEGHPVVRFSMVVGSNGDERYHNVYSTKRHATRIIEKDLHRGDPIALAGTVHRFGDEETIYAYGVRRTDNGGASEQRP